MTSSDREILISINDRVSRLEGEVAAFRTETLQRFDRIERRLDMSEARIEWLQTTVYWGFAIIAFIAAIIPSWHKQDSKELQPPTVITVPVPYIHQEGEKIS